MQSTGPFAKRGSGGSTSGNRRHGTLVLAGIAKLSNGPRSNTPYVNMPNSSGESLQHWSARHAFPSLEGQGAKRPLLFCVGVVTAMHEQIAHQIMDRSETLQVTR
jgi:hypothetical protein